LKLVHVGIIITTLVILLGVLSLTPAFLQVKPDKIILLSFSISDSENLPEWCEDLSKFLNQNSIKAVIFVTGKVAEQYPQCVSSYRSGIDIGSQTFSYVKLSEIPDYLEQLDEVKKGKSAVDKAGNLDSKIFKAPNGVTDENIYSLLIRSEILADFSYENQYNKYYHDKFLKFNLVSFQGSNHDVGFFKDLNFHETPIMIHFDNTVPVNEITDFISHLKSDEILFVNASELTGLELTLRKEMLV